jgi:hypothetical protein
MMFNSRLKTQPLDPAALQGLEAHPSAPARSPVQATAPLAPLRMPEMRSDSLATAPPPSGVPAQAVSLSTAAAPPAALSSEEAQLLLGISEKLGDLYKANRGQFTLAMQALEKVSGGGQVDFSRITPQQQQLLASLGLTAQNTATVYQQLYQLLLPSMQTQTSNAFQTVQSSVTSFLSNVDLRQQTFSNIESQARDLSQVMGVVSTLSAGSINDLLADQKDGVYDLSVSKITGQNFNLKSGMDYTLGHFVVLSQESPTTLQSVEGILQKVQSDQAVSPQERSLLNKYGLNVNTQNKLETIERKPLSLQEVQHLESVVFSMKDPSEGYQKVLSASADVIRQSKKLEELGQRASFEIVEVQKATVEVVAQNQNLQQTHQTTNQLNAKIQTAQSQAQQLQTAVQAAPSLVAANPSATLDVSPLLLAQWNISVQNGPEGQRFFIRGREVSQLEVTQHLGSLLKQQQLFIQQMASDLARSKSEALKATATLAQSTQKLETKTEQLEQTRAEIKVETIKLQELELTRLEVVKQAEPLLKPEERKMVQEVINPFVEKTVVSVQTRIEKLDQEIEQTVTQAKAAIVESKALQEGVLRDSRRWEKTLAQAEDLDKSIGQTLAKIPAGPEKTPITAGDAEKTEALLQAEKTKSAQFDSAPKSAEEVASRQEREELAKLHENIEHDNLERERLEEAQEQARELTRHNQKRAELDKAFFKQEIEQLRDKE